MVIKRKFYLKIENIKCVNDIGTILNRTMLH